MNTALPGVEEPSLVLHFGPVLQKMSDHDFFEFCQLNCDWRFERTYGGDLVITAPTGGKTGQRNFLLTTLFGSWVEADGTGVGFDSSTGFTLPNGAKRSSDLAWIRRLRWEALTEEQQAEFPLFKPRCRNTWRMAPSWVGLWIPRRSESISIGLVWRSNVLMNLTF